MSAALYNVCIFWIEQRGGRAKHDGVEVHLHCAPCIGKLKPRLVEFAPEVQMFQIAESAADPPRDMTPAEIADAEWWLSSNVSKPVRERIG